MYVGTVIAGQQCRDAQIDFRGYRQRCRQVGHFVAALQCRHRGIEHVGVERETDVVNLAALVFAEHLAGAADLQVVHGQEEARPQLLHRLDGIQTPLSLGRRLGFLVRQQIGVGLVVRAADPAAQLVQLGQAEAVGAVDDDGIGMRVVDACFDNGRAEQQVVLLLRELAHHTLQLAFGQLAVADHDACLGQ